jgi:hypothetical protein
VVNVRRIIARHGGRSGTQQKRIAVHATFCYCRRKERIEEALCAKWLLNWIKYARLTPYNTLFDLIMLWMDGGVAPETVAPTQAICRFQNSHY